MSLAGFQFRSILSGCIRKAVAAGRRKRWYVRGGGPTSRLAIAATHGPLPAEEGARRTTPSAALATPRSPCRCIPARRLSHHVSEAPCRVTVAGAAWLNAPLLWIFTFGRGPRGQRRPTPRFPRAVRRGAPSSLRCGGRSSPRAPAAPGGCRGRGLGLRGSRVTSLLRPPC